VLALLLIQIQHGGNTMENNELKYDCPANITEFEKQLTYNENCEICSYIRECKIPDDKRINCKAYTSRPAQNTIFGYTHDEIARMQGIKHLKK
jgi:hypothetical protein